MTLEIPEDKWNDFFNDLSRRRFGWNTKVEVFDNGIGHQILSDGLPLNGITCENVAGKKEIEILVGERVDRHQSHTIQDPVHVAFLNDDDLHGGILEINEKNGTRSLIYIMDPMPVYVGYSSYQLVTTQ